MSTLVHGHDNNNSWSWQHQFPFMTMQTSSHDDANSQSWQCQLLTSYWQHQLPVMATSIPGHDNANPLSWRQFPDMRTTVSTHGNTNSWSLKYQFPVMTTSVSGHEPTLPCVDPLLPSPFPAFLFPPMLQCCDDNFLRCFMNALTIVMYTPTAFTMVLLCTIVYYHVAQSYEFYYFLAKIVVLRKFVNIL